MLAAVTRPPVTSYVVTVSPLSEVLDKNRVKNCLLPVILLVDGGNLPVFEIACV